MTTNSIILCGTLVGLAAAAAAPLAAQSPAPEIIACYDAKTSPGGKPQGSGIVYRIKVSGVVPQQGCVDQDDVQFSWTVQHGALTGLDADDHKQYLLVSGARALTGNVSAGGNKITGLGWASANGDAVPFEQAIKTIDTANGDVAGPFPNLTVVGLQTRPVALQAPLEGHVLTWNGTAWAPGAPAVGATGTPDNVAGTLVQRDATTSGFAAGPVTLDGGFLARGVTGGAIPSTGPGARLMWHPGKAAFRAGEVTGPGTSWDDANVGLRSVAMGLNTTASGGAATAMGASTTASGDFSTAMGTNTTASGAGSTAMGASTAASGNVSTAMGEETTASGDFSTAMGHRTTASGFWSTAMGSLTTASGRSSTAMGAETTASGDNSTAMGAETTASGVNSTAMGEGTTASGVNSTAMGFLTTANGGFSTAMGNTASTNTRQGAFVYGDASTMDLVTAPADNSFVVRAAGGTIFYSNSDLAAGVSLAPGGGSWLNVSDVNRKEHFREVEGEDVLGKIARMSIREWSYKAQDPSIRHLGPTAQDFHAAFGLGESDTTITTTDIDGVNLLAVQALERRTREQAREIDALRAELAALRAEMAHRRP